MHSVFLITIIAFLFFAAPLPVLASGTSGIKLDGKFNDWDDKPVLNDKEGDEQPFKDIVAVKWFPDASGMNLYLYCERLGSGDKKEDKDNKGKGQDPDDDRYDENYDENTVDENEIYNDVFKNYSNNNRRFKYWVLTANFSSDLGERKAYILYHPPSRKVFVLLFDEKGNYLWSANGKWGDDKNAAKRIEFYIPLTNLVLSAGSGYEVDLYYESGGDRAPDGGAITILTIGTFPWFIASAALALAIFGFAFAVYKSAKTKQERNT